MNPKRHATQVWFAINRTRTRNKMHKSTHGVVDYFIKTMLSNVKNALFLHDIAQATWGRCILIVYRKILQNSKHLPSIYNKKVTVNFFLDTRYNWTLESNNIMLGIIMNNPNLVNSKYIFKNLEASVYFPLLGNTERYFQ